MQYDKLIGKQIQSIPSSGIRKYFDLLAGMDDAISLGVGEPDFPTPSYARQAGIRSLEQGLTKYTSNAGLPELREELSRYLARRLNLRYDPEDQIVITVGGSEGLDLAFRCLIDPGDEVIIPTPSFVCYGPLVEMEHGVPVYVETRAENDFRLTAQELQAAITEKTKLLVLPFPNNPTGGIMGKEDLDAIAATLRGTEILVVADEIYAELTYGAQHASLAHIPDMYERTVIISAFSKAYSMTGWRLGYLCGPKELISPMLKLHQYSIMSAPTVAQYAALEASRQGDADIDRMRQEYDRRRTFLLEGFRKLGLSCFEPKGAFYMFPSIQNAGLSSEEFCERLLMEQRVAVIPGTAFGPGGEGYVRACYAVSMENLQEALRRIELFLKGL